MTSSIRELPHLAEVQRARGQQTRTLNNCLRGSRTDFHLFCFLCHAHEGCVYARLVILSIICLATEEKEKYTIAREDDLSEGERNESARFGSVHIWKGFFIASIFRGRRVHYTRMICGASSALWKCGGREVGPEEKEKR